MIINEDKNCHSLVNKIFDLQYELCNRKIDLCLAVTCIKDDDTITLNLVPPDGYKIVSYPRLVYQKGE